MNVIFCYNKNMKKYNNKGWSDHEVDMLKKYYNTLTINEMREILNRTESSIRSKVHWLRKRGWTFHEKV